MANFQVLIFSAFCIILGYAHPGIRNKHELNIAGGVAIDITKAPYQVAVFTENRNIMLNCGGAIISENFIMVSGQCCFEIPIQTIRAGSTLFDKNGTVLHGKKTYIHPKFDMSEDYIDYDICLVETTTKINFGTTIQPIPVADAVPAEGKASTVAGWGIVQESGQFVSEVLLSAVLPISNQTLCKQAYPDYTLERFICAGGEGKGPCMGDGGSPLVTDGKATGIASFNLGCGRFGVPAGFTSVAHPEIRSFIRKIANV